MKIAQSSQRFLYKKAAAVEKIILTFILASQIIALKSDNYVNSKQLLTKLKETTKMMKSAKKKLQQEQTSTSRNFSKLLLKEEETALAHMIRNIIKEEVQTHKVVLQITLSSYLKITNERLECYQEKLVI